MTYSDFKVGDFIKLSEYCLDLADKVESEYRLKDLIDEVGMVMEIDSEWAVCFFPSKPHEENKDGVWWFKNKEIELAYNNSDSTNH